MDLARNILDLYLDAAPWMLSGLLVAGLVKAWMAEGTMRRWLGGRGFKPTLLAALLGAPLPICSCGVLPAAVGLRRAGASRGATVSFMISTPETGIDSVALSYALLGPFLAVARPLAAVASAVFTGMLTELRFPFAGPGPDPAADPVQSCCSGDGCESAPEERRGPGARTLAGLRFAMVDVLGDIAPWLAAGLVLAGVVTTMVPEQALAEWGRGPGAMAVMLVVGIPMYICASASTPLAAGLLLVGVSPGTVMVFLLAGPATNPATMAVVRKEMGTRTMVLYLLGICVSSLAAGVATDAVADWLAIDMAVEMAAGGEFVPWWLAAASGGVLGVLALRPYLARLVTAISSRAAA